MDNYRSLTCLRKGFELVIHIQKTWGTMSQCYKTDPICLTKCMRFPNFKLKTVCAWTHYFLKAPLKSCIPRMANKV